MSQHELAEIHRRYSEVKDRLQDLGFVIAGSVGERYLTCGKTNCRCKADPSQRHGPYIEYTRKLAGKTTGRRLTPRRPISTAPGSPTGAPSTRSPPRWTTCHIKQHGS